MVPTSRRLAAVGAVAALVVAAASCANIAGIDGTYRSAVGNMCACEDIAAAYGGDTESCTDWFESRIATAKHSVVADWLDTYIDLACDLCTPSYAATKLPCVHAPPCCVADGGACSAALDCCGYPDTAACLGATVGAGVCGACRDVGDACTTDEECCGYHGANAFLGYDPPYCNQTTHTCVREPPDCRRSFASCTTQSCCTGDFGFDCQPNPSNPIISYCIEACDPSNPHNCPGCCVVTFTGPEDPIPAGICADGQPEACKTYCPEEGAPCGKGGTCTRSCEPASGVLVSFSRCYLTCIE